MESKSAIEFIKKTIQEGEIEKIKDLFINNCFNILNEDDFVDLWEDPNIKLLESLLIVNREQNFYIFDGYSFPNKFKDFISNNIRPKIIEIFEKLEDNDIKTLVWLDYANSLKTKDFSKFSEKSIQRFIKNYYNIVINSEKFPLRNYWNIVKNFELKVKHSLSKPIKNLIIKIIEIKDLNEIVLIQVYGWLGLLNQKDFFDILNDQKLDFFKHIFTSIEKKSYEYHGFGEQLDKKIFDYFQKTLSPLEAKTLQDIQDTISEQLIIDYGYHEEIFHAYKVENNHVVKLWIPFTNIINLPKSIGNLKFLKSLNLSGCGLKCLPETIGNLKNLKSLDLSGCDLTALPESFVNLKNLEKLYIRGNCFNSVPESIKRLKSLKYFDVYDTDLIDYPPFRQD